jgi:hypothetical protein
MEVPVEGFGPPHAADNILERLSLLREEQAKLRQEMQMDQLRQENLKAKRKIRKKSSPKPLYRASSTRMSAYSSFNEKRISELAVPRRSPPNAPRRDRSESMSSASSSHPSVRRCGLAWPDTFGNTAPSYNDHDAHVRASMSAGVKEGDHVLQLHNSLMSGVLAKYGSSYHPVAPNMRQGSYSDSHKMHSAKHLCWSSPDIKSLQSLSHDLDGVVHAESFVEHDNPHLIRIDECALEAMIKREKALVLAGQRALAGQNDGNSHTSHPSFDTATLLGHHLTKLSRNRDNTALSISSPSSSASGHKQRHQWTNGHKQRIAQLEHEIYRLQNHQHYSSFQDIASRRGRGGEGIEDNGRHNVMGRDDQISQSQKHDRVGDGVHYHGDNVCAHERKRSFDDADGKIQVEDVKADENTAHERKHAVTRMSSCNARLQEEIAKKATLKAENEALVQDQHCQQDRELERCRDEKKWESLPEPKLHEETERARAIATEMDQPIERGECTRIHGQGDRELLMLNTTSDQDKAQDNQSCACDSTMAQESMRQTDIDENMNTKEESPAAVTSQEAEYRRALETNRKLMREIEEVEGRLASSNLRLMNADKANMAALAQVRLLQSKVAMLQHDVTHERHRALEEAEDVHNKRLAEFKAREEELKRALKEAQVERHAAQAEVEALRESVKASQEAVVSTRAMLEQQSEDHANVMRLLHLQLLQAQEREKESKDTEESHKAAVEKLQQKIAAMHVAHAEEEQELMQRLRAEQHLAALAECSSAKCGSEADLRAEVQRLEREVTALKAQANTHALSTPSLHSRRADGDGGEKGQAKHASQRHTHTLHLQPELHSAAEAEQAWAVPVPPQEGTSEARGLREGKYEARGVDARGLRGGRGSPSSPSRQQHTAAEAEQMWAAEASACCEAGGLRDEARGVRGGRGRGSPNRQQRTSVDLRNRRSASPALRKGGTGGTGARGDASGLCKKSGEIGILILNLRGPIYPHSKG